jgi:hypothetical protein
MSSERTCKIPNLPWLVGANSDTKIALIFEAQCGLWSCPSCAKRMQAHWAQRAALLVESAIAPRSFDFVTLTNSGDLETFAQTLWVFPRAWGNLYSRLKRYDKDFSYLLIPELHVDHRVHLHVLTDFAVPAKFFVYNRARANTRVKRMKKSNLEYALEKQDMDSFWKQIPPLCGFGYSTDQEPVRDARGASSYVAKELTKQLNINTWPEHFKHIRHSQNFPELEKNEDYVYQVFMQEVEAREKINILRKLGYRLLERSTGEMS